MRTLTTALALATITTVAQPPSLHADVIQMDHGDQLTGIIKSLNEKEVSLLSQLSPTLLKVKSKSIQQITFDPQPQPATTHTELVTLSNGDILPCEVVSLDSQTLNITTWYAGNFSIPRHHVQTLQFGISQDQVIYQGTDAPSEWSTNEGQWTLTEDGYSSEGPATLARKLDLQNHLHINFDLAWKDSPEIVFRFFAENAEAKKNQDCYEFAFNSAGMQIRRFLKKQRATPITSIDLQPHTINNQKINVDLRINRTSGKITLSLDGVERGSWIDSLEAVKGNYIIINNRNTRGKGCSLDNLRITQWTEGAQPRYQEKINQETLDILIDSEGEKISGDIVGIHTNDTGKRKINLKVKYTPKPLIVPAHRISSLIFAKKTSQKDPPVDQPHPEPYFSAQIMGGGTLHLANPKLNQQHITTTHPILGNCTINTTVISRILYHKVQPPAPSKKISTPNS